MDENNVDVKLYEFLKNNETGLYTKNDEIVAYVHIEFYDISKFVEIIGDCYFDEGGMQVLMFNNTICVEVQDIITEGYGHNLSNYKDCFYDYDWNTYKNEIKEVESKY